MPYRRTENVERKLAARHQAILDAAKALATEGGMGAVQIAPVAARANIAAGTFYRYFPAKTDLVAAVVAAVSEQEITALRQAVNAAPGPLSALAAAITTFAARASRRVGKQNSRRHNGRESTDARRQPNCSCDSWRAH